jgi:hypothetical protein
MAAEQSSIELIIEKQNEMNIDDFVQWLNTNYEEIKDMHKLEVMAAYDSGQEDAYESGFSNKGALVYYRELYG